MRIHGKLILVATIAISSVGRADGPPAEKPASLSPKETMIDWSRRATSMTVDDAMEMFAYRGDKEKSCAKSHAEESVALAQLQKAVREKWGKDAEANILHACGADTVEDDETIQVTISGPKGENARVKFKGEDVSAPPLLVRGDDGKWRFSVEDMLATDALPFDDSQAFTRRYTALFGSMRDGIVQGKYKTVDKLENDLKAELKKLDDDSTKRANEVLAGKKK